MNEVMDKTGYSLEQMFEVWTDKSGECVEIGPDRDGLELIEIRYKDETGKITSRLCFTKEQAKLVCTALGKLTL